MKKLTLFLFILTVSSTSTGQGTSPLSKNAFEQNPPREEDCKEYLIKSLQEQFTLEKKIGDVCLEKDSEGESLV